MFRYFFTILLSCMLCMNVYGESLFTDAASPDPDLSFEEGILSPPRAGASDSLFTTSMPPAAVSYEDLPDSVTAGTIRYVQQNAGEFSDRFYSFFSPSRSPSSLTDPSN